MQLRRNLAKGFKDRVNLPPTDVTAEHRFEGKTGRETEINREGSRCESEAKKKRWMFILQEGGLP